jgi:hypothetical protein
MFRILSDWADALMFLTLKPVQFGLLFIGIVGFLLQLFG